MANEDKVYYPETIEPNLLPVDVPTESYSGNMVVSGAGNDKQYLPTQIPSDLPPAKIVASDLISTSFDSQSRRILGSFTFATLGAIQIGTYASGVSGDVKISPSGIVARNSAGTTTFSLDGETGDATFLGTVAAGSVIAASISADNITAGTLTVAAALGDDSIILDGANKRFIVNDGTDDRILIGYLSGGF